MNRNPMRLKAAFAVVLILTAGLVYVPQASAATYGHVYISLPTWQGNCAWGKVGKVKIISGSVDGVSSVSYDRDDDIVYMKVRMHANNRVQFEAYCDKWPGFWQPGFAQTIRPTRNNQTWWVGPAGKRSN